MKWLLVCVCCCFVFTVNSQSKFYYSLEWTRGSIVLQTGDTIPCQLRYNQSLPESVLQVLDGENILSLSPKEVKAFFYLDEKKSKLRSFHSLQLPMERSLTNPYFCERLYNNSRFAILRHRTLGAPYEYMNYSRFMRKSVMISEKYILDEASGKLLPMTRENMMLLMVEKKHHISAFIQDNSIKFKTTADYIRVLEYHNTL